MSHRTLTDSVPFPLSWVDVETSVRILAEDLRASGRVPTTILGITRGGLIPAVMLSHFLGVPSMEAFSAEAQEDRESTLIVDDILDTMGTYKYVRERFPFSMYAVLVSKQPTHVLAKDVLYGMRCDPKVWIIFPWEELHA